MNSYEEKGRYIHSFMFTVIPEMKHRLANIETAFNDKHLENEEDLNKVINSVAVEITQLSNMLNAYKADIINLYVGINTQFRDMSELLRASGFKEKQ